MAAQTTRWFEYGEPASGDADCVPAVVRTEYQTGPNETARNDEIAIGMIDIEALGLLDEEPFADHIHSDGSLALSYLPDAAEDRLLASFELDSDRDRLLELIGAGCSPAEAVDYLMTERTPLSQTEWATRRGRSQQAISENVMKAKQKIK